MPAYLPDIVNILPKTRSGVAVSAIFPAGLSDRSIEHISLMMACYGAKLGLNGQPDYHFKRCGVIVRDIIEASCGWSNGFC